MTSEGSIIVEFMKASPESWYARKEISRRAVHRSEYEANPHWATAALNALVNDGIIEQNDAGLYRIAPPKKSGILKL